jgi:hypothetical protein
LARLSFVRQLVPHSASIDAVGINELTGDIATCSSSWLHLWSVNGGKRHFIVFYDVINKFIIIIISRFNWTD